jgi:hypothetical protein
VQRLLEGQARLVLVPEGDARGVLGAMVASTSPPREQRPAGAPPRPQG